MSPIRRTVLFSGTVQGVGFRWSTHRLLAGSAVTGYVRNLADGRVELVVEGTSEETGHAVQRVREGLARFIRGVDESSGPASGEFTGFAIRA